jgi:hypothetical protein
MFADGYLAHSVTWLLNGPRDAIIFIVDVVWISVIDVVVDGRFLGINVIRCHKYIDSQLFVIYFRWSMNFLSFYVGGSGTVGTSTWERMLPAM